MASSAPAARPLAGASVPLRISAQPSRVALLPRARLPTRCLSLGRPSQLSARGRSVRCLAALSPEMQATLDKVVSSHKVVLFMKGTKDFPECGFSHTVVQILRSLDVPFETLDVLANEALRQGLKEYSSWPTFPQLYIDGEFFGGCDITVGMYVFLASLKFNDVWGSGRFDVCYHEY
jgi:monothiol glutaredoxin